VNIAAEGTIDWAAQQLTLFVEVYYTANSAQGTNKLSVAMIQNEIIGPQSGKERNPNMVEGDLYRHQHMFRDFITGQWGVDVASTTTGSVWSETFIYDIPPHINDVDVALEDIEFLVFVAENEKTIITGIKATINHVNLPEIGARIPMLREIPVYDCTQDANAYVTIKNLGSNSLTSVEFTYTIADGAPNTLLWNRRSIPTMGVDTVHLPVFQTQQNQNQEKQQQQNCTVQGIV
jgi:hypothetical protein